MGSFTAMTPFITGMIRFMTGVTLFMAGVMSLVLTGGCSSCRPVEPAVRPGVGSSREERWIA
jgi:hypothetical protein